MRAMRHLPILLTLTFAGPAAAMPGTCETPDLVEDFLSGSRTVRDRPLTEAWIDSDLYPVRVHYLFEDEHLVAPVLEALELSWQMEVEGWGWDHPDSDGGGGGSEDLDLYIYETDIGVGGYFSPEVLSVDDTHARCTGHLVVNRHSGGDWMGAVVSHELNHALQLWTDCVEDPQLMEGSAVFAEDWVFPGVEATWAFAATFQQNCHLPLDYFVHGEMQEYGSFVFLQYLAERFGDDTPASTATLWADSVQGSSGNNNTWIDALERWLAANWPADLDFPSGDEQYVELAWREFGEWRFFVGEEWDPYHLSHGEVANTTIGIELPLIGTASDWSLREGPVVLDLYDPLAELSSSAAQIRYPEIGWIVHADIEAASAQDRWALSMISIDTGDDLVLDRTHGEITRGEASVSTEVIDDVDVVLIVVANVGDGDLDPRHNDWDGTDATLTLWVEDPEAPVDDDDDDGDDGDGGSCACRATPAEGGMAATTALLLAALVQRRRRAPPRPWDDPTS
jgi:MYXO-CTERM domain-containing protein